MARDFERLRDLGKRQGDVVLFAAGMIQAAKAVVQDNINCEEAASRSL